MIGSGVQGRSHVEAMQTVLDDPIIRIWSRNPAHAEALALETHSLVADSIEDALDGADIVCTTTAAREPIVERAWLAPGTHVNAVGASIPTARELSAEVVAAASLFVDRRESTLNESGDYLMAVEEAGIGPDHIVAELGEVLTGAHPGRSCGERADALQVARHRRRGSRGGRALRRARARARDRDARSTSDPARRDRGSP